MRLPLVALVLPGILAAQSRTADWPVAGGTTDNSHYSTLSQITPANVARLQVAWSYTTGDHWKGSEMQANPIVIGGVLYATSPKLRVFALDAATGKELWSFDPNPGRPAPQRFRHRGVVVTGDRVLFTYRYRLYALDRKTGQLITTFGDSSGYVDMRNAFDRPRETISVSASSPGVVYGDLLILGSTVPEALPSSPGDIRAYEIATGKLRWIFHTIPRPGEFGYESWSPDAWKTVGGANAWSGVTVDQRRGIVFAATGSPSFDFYGANRVGDNLFGNTLLALDARTGKRLWHFQAIKHDLWDWDFPAAPTLVTLRRGGGAIVDAVAQITKTGYVYVFERETGRSLYPIAWMKTFRSEMEGEVVADSQPYPTAPPPFIRQQLTESILTTRTPAAHDSAVKFFRSYSTRGMYDPPNTRGTIIFPGVDGGGEWGGPAFDPRTGLLYVNANEMPWHHKLVARSDRNVYSASCAGCHGENRQGTAVGPRLDSLGSRSRDQLVQIVRQGTGRMPAFAGTLDNVTINDIVNYLQTGKDVAMQVGVNPNILKYRSSGLEIWYDGPDSLPPITPPWGTLNAIDLNAGTIKWSVPFGEYPKLAAQGVKNTGSDNYGGPVVTENGLLFIGATTYDRKFRVYDKRDGRLLWETTLPYSGNATPSLYMVNGKQYVVIACGGGKNEMESGGTYVAFALPQGR